MYLRQTKEVLNTCMKKVPKEATQFANQSDSSRCFVHLYKEYLHHDPPDWSDCAFYLTPLKQPKGDIWFSKVPLGHNIYASENHFPTDDCCRI